MKWDEFQNMRKHLKSGDWVNVKWRYGWRRVVGKNYKQCRLQIEEIWGDGYIFVGDFHLSYRNILSIEKCWGEKE